MNRKDINVRIGFAVLLAPLAAGCASSGNQASGPDTSELATTQQIEGDPNRMVCRRENDTGSRLSKRTCKTAREWEQERLDNQEAIRNATRSGSRPSDMPTAGGG
jgi:hypothetical protein